MDRRFEVRKLEILKEAEVKPQVTNGILKRLKRFIAGHELMSAMARRDRWYWRLSKDVCWRELNGVAATQQKNFW